MADKLLYTSQDSQMFHVILKVLRDHFKDYSAERVEKTVKVNGAGTFKFVVDWQDSEQSSFDVYKVLENI